jgi:DNA-binding NarL/FixJ family response regulator
MMDTSQLSAIEVEVLRLIADGLSDSEIAAVLRRSLYTVRTHRDHLLVKTACHNRVELTRFAVAAGLVPVDWDQVSSQE